MSAGADPKEPREESEMRAAGVAVRAALRRMAAALKVSDRLGAKETMEASKLA